MKSNSCFPAATFPAVASIISAVLLLCPSTTRAQGVAPGPYEVLPFEDAYIVEAYTDLLAGTQIADWTGFFGASAAAWESPNAYNTHEGTDFSMATGTPVYAAVSGTVSSRQTSISENSGTGYGNFVKIAATGLSPRGEQLDVLTAHLLPTVQVTVGQSVTAGQLIAYSDNTGNSTSEHCHVESSRRVGGATACAFYNAHYKYPIMFNHNARVQVGHVVKVKSTQTSIRTDRFDTSPVINTAHQNQLYFACFWKQGYYKVFIPDNATYRTGWIRAIDVDEVFEGSVIQALPDVGTYVHNAQLAATYVVRATANDAAAEIGRIHWGGGRFVADQTAVGGWYRVPLPGASSTFGWVKADNNMVVYPQLYNPAVNIAARPHRNLPQTNSFSVAGATNWGRPKFDRGVVQSFSPASPGGDGLAYFLTDSVNTGEGVHEAISVGNVHLQDYYVECDVYFHYNPPQGVFQRCGIYFRDDGFAGFDQAFEGKGNCYAFTWDSDDGRLRACKIIDTVITDMFPTAQSVVSSGWHKMRIEGQGTTLRFYLDGTLRLQTTDSTFTSGPCGFAYSSHFSGFPAGRGAYFDNFNANTFTTANAAEWALYE